MKPSTEITDAIEVTDSVDLISELSKATEHKAPGKESTSNYWDWDAAELNTDLNPPVQPGAPPAPGEQSDTKPTPQPSPAGPKITDKAKRSSARTAVGMLDMVQKGLFTPVLTHKFKKKFTEEEVERLEDLVDKDKKSLENDDLTLRNKWDRLFKKMEKKKEAIPFEEEEKKDLEEAFYAYFDYKEKTLPPEWFVGMAIANALGKRAIDVFMD